MTSTRHYQVFPIVDYVPAPEIIRKPLDLSSITADQEVIPTPAEVAARTVPVLSSAQPLILPDLPILAEASIIPTPPALVSAPPARTVPSPAEVAARTVPIKRAEAARREAELVTKSEATSPVSSTSAAEPRNLLRTMLLRLVRRLRRH